MGRRKMHTEYVWRNLKGRDHKTYVKMGGQSRSWTGLMGLGIGTSIKPL
jgi:hypothetical protein